MITLSKVQQATKEFVKILRFGKKDIKTTDPVFSHGIDSKPVKKDVAVCASTSNDSTTICLGYVKNSDKTGEGELCIYATDVDGARVFEMYFKNDGSVEFGGSGDFLAKFSELKNGFDQLVNDFNSHIHPTPSGPSSPPDTPSTADIDGAKINNIEVEG